MALTRLSRCGHRVVERVEQQMFEMELRGEPAILVLGPPRHQVVTAYPLEFQ